MDLKELNYVVTVANEGSISRAAEKHVFSRAPDHKMCINGCVRNAEKVIC